MTDAQFISRLVPPRSEELVIRMPVDRAANADHCLAPAGGPVVVNDSVNLKIDTIRLGVNVKLF